MDSISGYSSYNYQPAMESGNIDSEIDPGESSPSEDTSEGAPASTADNAGISEEAREEKSKPSGQSGAKDILSWFGDSGDKKDMADEKSNPAEGKAPAAKKEDGATAKKDMEFYEKMASELGHSVGGDGKQKPLSDDQKRILAEGLSRYDSGVLDKLKQIGMKFDIFDTKNPPPGGFPKGSVLDDTSKWEDNKAGYYSKDSKTICLRQDSFEGGMKEDTLNTITHETAHAVDDLLEADYPSKESPTSEFMSFKDETLKSLYNSYNERCDNYSREGISRIGFPSATAGDAQGGSLAGEQKENPQWSGYARTNESEYFAEGMMKYTAGGEAKEGFKKADPDLYAFVEKKMDQAKGPLPEYKAPPPPTPEQARKMREAFSLPSEVSGALLTGNMEETKKILGEFPDYLKQGSFGGIHPLYAAAFGEKPKEMLAFLAGQGMDINAKAMGGRTVLEMAQEAGRKEVVEILRSLGAKDKQ
ncbi:MAG: hypothetical protein RDV48_05730 [Candidatus Eremiobacteraeota bacterium]|nr:hypothetical protein [Candidatus Eremiobacteraeota bacterium]